MEERQGGEDAGWRSGRIDGSQGGEATAWTSGTEDAEKLGSQVPGMKGPCIDSLQTIGSKSIQSQTNVLD